MAEAERHLLAIRRARAIALYGRRLGGDTGDVSDAYADQLLAAGMAAHVDQMLTFTARGTTADVRGYLDGFLERTGVDELIVAHHAPELDARLHSVELLAEALETVSA